MNNIIYFNGCCIDGVLSAYIYNFYNNNANNYFVPVGFNPSFGPNSIYPGKKYRFIPRHNLIFLDTAPKIDQIEELMSVKYGQILMIDHHDSALELLNAMHHSQYINQIDFTGDMARRNAKMKAIIASDICAAQLTFDYCMRNYHNKRPINHNHYNGLCGLIPFVQDRDMWKWDLDKSREINAYLTSKIIFPTNNQQTLVAFSHLSDIINEFGICSGPPRMFIRIGYEILKCNERIINCILQTTQYYIIHVPDMGPLKCAVVQGVMFRGEISFQLFKMHDRNIDFVIFYNYNLNEDIFQLVLRTNKYHANVCAIAKKMGDYWGWSIVGADRTINNLNYKSGLNPRDKRSARCAVSGKCFRAALQKLGSVGAIS